MYRTGDYGYVDERGMIFFRGRVDRQVKIAGHRVECDAVEALLEELCGKPVAVVVDRDKKGEAVLRAFVESRERTLTLGLELVREHLPAFMVPRSIVVVKEFPKGRHGKVDREQLVEESRSLASREKARLVNTVRNMSESQALTALQQLRLEQGD